MECYNRITNSDISVLILNDICQNMAKTGRLLFLVVLALSVCFNVWGLCFTEMCPETIAPEPLTADCSEQAAPATDVNRPTVSRAHSHQHPHPSFHLHETVPVLPRLKDKELRPETSRPETFAPLLIQTVPASAGPFHLPGLMTVQEPSGCSAWSLSGQTLPLLI